MARKRKRPGPATPLRSQERRFSIPPRTVLLLCLLVFLVLALLSFDPKPFLGGDNATYILLAKGMLQGKGFRDIWAPGMPAHTQYPFGFPLLLTPFVGLFPNSVVPIKLFILALALASLWLVWVLGKDAWPDEERLFLAALLALSPALIEFSHWELSEVPYLCVSFLALFLLQGREGEWKDWRFWLGVIAMAFAYHIRTAGIALVVSLPVYLILRRRWASFGITLAGLFLLLFPWALRNRGVSHQGGYIQQLLLKDTYNPALGYTGISDLISRFGANLKIYALQVVPGFLFPGLGEAQAGGIVTLIGFLLVLLCLWGLIVQIRRKLGLIPIYLVCYLGVALLWPSVWSDRRFLLPVLPLILAVFITGCFSLSGVLWKQKPKVIGIVLIAFSGLMALRANIAVIPGQVNDNLAYIRGDEFAGYPEPWVTFFQAADWVKEHSGPEAIVVSRKPTLFCLRAGRQSFIYPFSPNPDTVLDAIKSNHADFIVVDPFGGTTQRFLIPAIQPHVPERFEVVYQTSEPATYVLKVKSP
jgi:hypothetical protein